MDLALHFPCVNPMINQGFRSAKLVTLFMSEIADAHSTSFGQCLSRTAFNGDRSVRRQQIATSSSMRRSKKGTVCSKKLSNEGTSNPSKSKQEEIISLFRRIQSSISKEESPGGLEEKKNRNGSPENVPLSKAILAILEKPRKKTEAVGDTDKKETPKRQVKVARPPSSFAKRSPIRPSDSGKLQVSRTTTDKEEKAPLIETMKLAELKEVAKNRGIKGYSKLKKSELLELIREC